MADPSTWQITVEAVGTAASAVVLIGGAALAARYGRKANPSIEASAHTRPDDRIILTARVSVTVPGVLPIRLAKEGPHAPLVRVVEVLISEDGYLRTGNEYEGKKGIFKGERVNAGETVANTDEFPLPAPTINLVGWRVSLLVDVRRHLRFLYKEKWWRWGAGCFVPVPDKPEPEKSTSVKITQEKSGATSFVIGGV
jgi:hypothetical protein